LNTRRSRTPISDKMSTQLHQSGEEYESGVQIGTISKVSSVEVGVFHDGEVSGDTTNGDDLADSDDVGAITTEPSGSAYSRETVSLDSTEFSVVQESGNFQFESDNEIGTIDLSDDNSGTIDAYFVVINVQLSGDSSPTDHLWFSGNLSVSYDLSKTNGVDLQAGGVGRSID